MGSKSVLILGYGLSSGPLLPYLCDHGVHVVVGTRTKSRTDQVCQGRSNVETLTLDIEKEEGKKLLEEIVPKVDAVISMLPYVFHPVVAEVAVRHKKHFLTTSYESDAIKALAPAAEQAGVVLINECGVDPGTDHMSAMKIIDSAHQKGGKVISFTSYCGGLPAPANNDNPFGYKFSWAPRGVLLAGKNSALFLKDGKQVTISGDVLFDQFWLDEVDEEEVKGIKFETYPNRDSVKYVDVYGIPEVQTLIRGTYRYQGWCGTIKKLVELGFMELEEVVLPNTFAELTRSLVGTDSDGDLRSAVAKKLNLPKDHFTLSNMEWLGLFSADEKIPSGPKSRLDALCALMLSKMQYKAGEKDLLVLKHAFTIEYSDRRDYITSTLVSLGLDDTRTSMSRTVSYPVAIATRLVLEGKFTKPGLHRPIIPELYEPILQELATFGIEYREKLVKSEAL